MEEKIDVKKLVDSYIWQVNDVEKALATLAQDADVLSREIEEHEAARKVSQDQREALERQRASLQGERNSLMGQHAEASFTGDTAQLQTISRRRVQLEKELEDVEENIRGLNVVPSNDYGERAAGLRVRYEELAQRVPSHYMLPMHVSTLTPFLKSIHDSMQADSTRLSEKLKDIRVPAVYSSKQLEDLKRENGTSTKLDPAFLRVQEEKRQAREKETRRNRINASRAAVIGAEPAHTGGEIREYDGDAVREILAAKTA